MLKKIALVSSLLLPLTVQAESFTDVYGDSNLKPNKTMQKYIKQLGDTQNALMPFVLSGNQKVAQKDAQVLMHKKFILEEKIKKEGNYAYVTSKGIYYPNKNFYTTIDVVRKDDSVRLSFVPLTEHATAKPEVNMSHNKNDIIDKRIKFDTLEASLASSNQFDNKPYYCPVYSCTAGFSDHRLKPYLPVFNKAAVAEKQLIIKTLRNDPDPSRRAAAALLVGHFKDPKEIITVLSPIINDSDENVRNNALQVLGVTVDKSKFTNLDLTPFLKLLNSPVVTDRTQALLLVSAVASNPQYKQKIVQEGGDNLIALLNLYQPNNHDLAYTVLKKVSDKHYAARDIKGWSDWLATKRASAA